MCECQMVAHLTPSSITTMEELLERGGRVAVGKLEQLEIELAGCYEKH